jgi:hypothetical protein
VRVSHTAFHRRKTTLRVVSSCLALGISLGAGFAASVADSQAARQSKQLAPVTLASTEDTAADPLAAIWKDKLPELQARLAGRSPMFFAASFSDGDATIIVSASVNDPTCENLSGALGRPTTGSDCPMRVALLKHGAVSILSASDHFVLPTPIDASGAFEPPSANNAATITFDPASNSLRISERIDGENADAVNSSPILLKY